MTDENKLSLLVHGVSFLEGQRANIQKEFDSLKESVSLAKHKDELQPLVVEALERIQKQEHERSVGVFSKLLSALSKDVLPHLAKPVVLDLYTAHGAPALDIEIAAGDKFKEEITSGAMKNVLSVGLRLIAISRTKQRRFLVLDEPDHWIKPENVPQFVNVLDKIIRELGFQILMISHHPNSFFDQVAKCVHLDYDSSGKLSVTGDLEPEPHKGLQALRLIDFESHSDTIIPLHEGMTVLTGDNGLGKSSVIRGLKALFHGETHNDRIIKHVPEEASCCRVELQLEGGRWAGWRRVRKSNATMRHKNRYYVRQSETLPEDENSYLVAEDTSDSVPDFIQALINVKPSDKWDLHLAGQEESVFLINRMTKATERAKILALGNEAQVLHAMIEQNRLDSRKNKEFIRESEKKLGVWLRQLNATIDFENLIKIPLNKLIAEEKSVISQKDRIVSGTEMLEKVKMRRENMFQWRTISNLAPRLPQPPVLKDTNELKELLDGLKWSLKWSQVKKLPKIEESPLFVDINSLSKYILDIKTAKFKAQMSSSFTEIANPPSIKPTEGVLGFIETIKSQRKASDVAILDLNEKQKELKDIELKIKEVWGAVDECPLCGQAVIHQH